MADFRGSKAADTSAKLGQGQGTGQAEGGTGSQHGGGMQQGGGPTGRVVMPEGVQLVGGEALLEEQAAGRPLTLTTLTSHPHLSPSPLTLTSPSPLTLTSKPHLQF